MRQFKTVLIIFLVLGFSSCKNDQKAENDANVNVSTFYFIRHAEKDRTDPNNVDPELTQKGLGRAMHWAEILKDVELDAIYSTDYLRTAMTAAPTSVKRDIDVQYYDPNTIDLEQFKEENLNSNVLVVGHSNTTPEFVNKMIGEEEYAWLEDDNNGTLFIVQVVNETVTVQQLYFNCNCPE